MGCRPYCVRGFRHRSNVNITFTEELEPIPPHAPPLLSGSCSRSPARFAVRCHLAVRPRLAHVRLAITKKSAVPHGQHSSSLSRDASAHYRDTLAIVYRSNIRCRSKIRRIVSAFPAARASAINSVARAVS